MSFLVVANGSKPKAVNTIRELQKSHPKHLAIKYFTSEHRGQIEQLVADEGSQYKTIVLIGGDGTVHECVNGIMQIEQKQRPSLFVIPRGTGNDFSRLFKHSSNPWEVAVNGPSQLVDVIEVSDDDGHVRYCGNIGDAGLGAAVVAKANQLPLAIRGAARFGVAILQTFLTYRKQHMCITTDQMRFEKKFLTIAFAKGKYFGSGIGIAPHAQLNDGFIHATLIGEVSLLEYLRYLPRLKKAKAINHSEVNYITTKNMTLTGEGKVELDGEISFSLPVEIKVHENAIRWIGELR